MKVPFNSFFCKFWCFPWLYFWLLHWSLLCSSGCEGAPFLPLLYIFVNICFNISVLHLVKISSAVVSSLAAISSGSLSQNTFKMIRICCKTVLAPEKWAPFSLFCIHLFYMAFFALCSSNCNIYSFPSAALSAGRCEFEPIFSSGQYYSCDRSHPLQRSPTSRGEVEYWWLICLSLLSVWKNSITMFL